MYGNIPVYIAETGFSDTNGNIHDDKRIDFFRNYTNEVLKGNLKKHNIFMFYLSSSIKNIKKNFVTILVLGVEMLFVF